MDLEKRLKHGELTNPDSIHFDDSLKYYTVRKHRLVYGGGGIMPDYFVPLDTMKFTRFHRQLAVKNIIMDAYLKYVDTNRKSLRAKYTAFDAFVKSYEVPENLIQNIVAEGKKQKIEPTDDAERERTIAYIKLQIKSLVARDIWNMNEYFRIWNEASDIVKKALEVVGKPLPN